MGSARWMKTWEANPEGGLAPSTWAHARTSTPRTPANLLKPPERALRHVRSVALGTELTAKLIQGSLTRLPANCECQVASGGDGKCGCRRGCMWEVPVRSRFRQDSQDRAAAAGRLPCQTLGITSAGDCVPERNVPGTVGQRKTSTSDDTASIHENASGMVGGAVTSEDCGGVPQPIARRITR